uniref:TctD-like protein n=1 Tax=Dermonema virens TaxID=1077399 RepID=A0A1G4NS43_9FLOR|nr:Hypothetical protein ycf29 [Dermonema virens]SCW21435.1 Hypothetical protein ycf29 [Dermonema virens]
MLAKILLVDDDLTLLSSVSSYLVHEGFSVDTAYTVSLAIKMLTKINYNLIISDIVLPGQNGYSLIDYVHKQNHMVSLPFIFLTAKGMTKDRILGYDLGCHAYLTKPFDPAELVSIIKNILMKEKRKHILNISAQDITSYSDKSSLILEKDEKMISSLTEREKCVLQFVLLGMTNKEIAAKLDVTVRNVEKYVSRLLSKTNTRNRTQLAQYFYNQRVLDNQGE